MGLKFPKTSSEIPLLLTFFPICFLFNSLFSSKGTSSKSLSESDSWDCTYLLAGIRWMITEMFLKPGEGKLGGVCWSFLDDFIDEGLDEGVDVFG